MKIVTYEVENKTKLGIFSADEQWVYPLECFGMEYKEMQEAIAEMSDSEIQLLGSIRDPRRSADRGSEDPGSDLKTEAGCDLSGHQLYGSC